MPMTATEQVRSKRTMIKASSTERVKKILELVGDKHKVAEALGVSAGHLLDVVNGRSPCPKLLDVGCEALLRRFNKEEKEPAKTVMVLKMTEVQAAVVRPLLKALDIKPGMDIEVYDKECERHEMMIFACDAVHYATVHKVIMSLGIKQCKFQ